MIHKVEEPWNQQTDTLSFIKQLYEYNLLPCNTVYSKHKFLLERLNSNKIYKTIDKICDFTEVVAPERCHSDRLDCILYAERGQALNYVLNKSYCETERVLSLPTADC